MTTIEATQTFGVEIEFTGLSRRQAADAVANELGGILEYKGHVHGLDTYHVYSTDGRVWKVVSDSSVTGSNMNRGGEMVTPPLRYEEMESFQKVVRALRKAGAKADASCGLHVHVNGRDMSAKAIRNFTNMVRKNERLMVQAFNVSGSRVARWAQYMDDEVASAVSRMRSPSREALRAAWYKASDGEAILRARRHYDHSRYHGFNLHSLFGTNGTIEFRYFNGTLHAGRIKSYVQFALAMKAKAMKARSTSATQRPFNPATAKYDFRTLLLALGMSGDEFKTARLHLLKNLSGDAAFRNGRPASA